MKLEQMVALITQTESGCWEWTGAQLASGYGSVRFDGRVQVVHRVMWEQVKGPVPAGLQLDHLCRNRTCCNPAHLEAVTQRTNLLRGVSLPAQNARRDKCLNGHEFDIRRKGNGWRECSICKKARRRAYRERTGR